MLVSNPKIVAAKTFSILMYMFELEYYFSLYLVYMSFARKCFRRKKNPILGYVL